MPKNPPFKMFPFAWRERAMLALSPVQYKIWSYIRWGSGANDTLTESNEQIAKKTGIHKSTIKETKKWLRDNGWLEGKSTDRHKAACLRAVFPGPVEECNGPESTAYSKPELAAYTRPESASDGISGPSSKYASQGQTQKPCLPVDLSPKIGESTTVEAAVDAQRAATTAVVALPDLNREAIDLMEVFYSRFHKTELPERNSTRWQTDYKAALYVTGVVSVWRELLDWVLAYQDENTGFRWDTKTPNLISLAKHVSKGWGEGLLKQFSDETKHTEDSASVITDGECQRCGFVCDMIGRATNYLCLECFHDNPTRLPKNNNCGYRRADDPAEWPQDSVPFSLKEFEAMTDEEIFGSKPVSFTSEQAAAMMKEKIQ